MFRQPNAKRTQFSSCDACRFSRVGCDASKLAQIALRTADGPCSRCRRKNQTCTFEWRNQATTKRYSDAQRGMCLLRGIPSQSEPSVSRSTPTRVGQARRGRSRRNGPDCLSSRPLTPRDSDSPDLTSFLSSRAAGETDTLVHSEAQTPHSGLSKEVLASWTKKIFRHSFEASYGLLLGRYGCPFVDDPTSDLSSPLTELMRKLDVENRFEEIRTPIATTTTSTTIRTYSSSPSSHAPFAVEKCVDRAILAFAARWFPSRPGGSDLDEIVTTSWRSSRSDMSMLLNQVSYQSVLSLYLFAQTPVPAAISEEEELSGITGPVCMHTALMHIQKLRQRCDPVKKGRLNITQSFLNLESRAYWAAVMWDTSAAMNSEMRTLLTSGLNGACSEPAWRLSKLFLVGSFGPATENWCVDEVEVTDEDASRIIGAASVCQVLLWKNITSVKEALREGVDEQTVLWVWGSLRETMVLFRKSIRPLLRVCEERIHFLGQGNRYTWFQVKLQHCAGVMILAEALQLAKRDDLLLQLQQDRKEVEHESFTLLKFGTDNMYRMSTQDILEAESDSVSTVPSVRLSFIALYAFSCHVVTLAQLLGGVIVQKLHAEEVDEEGFVHLSSIVMEALKQLPTSSRVVKSAIRDWTAFVKEAMA